MSIRAMSWAWEHSRAEGAALLVLLKIADHAGDDGRDAYPGQASLAKACRVSVRTVRRHVDDLVALGEVAVEEYGGPRSENAGRRTHRYSLPGYIASLAPPELPVKLAANPEPEVGVVGQTDESCGTNEAELADTGVRGIIPTEPSSLNQDLLPPSARGKPKGGWARLGADHVLYQEAETTARAVWDEMDPKPALEYTMLRGLIARFLDAGWSPMLVGGALLRTRTFTVAAVEYELRRWKETDRSGSSRFDSILDEYRRQQGIA